MIGNQNNQEFYNNLKTTSEDYNEGDDILIQNNNIHNWKRGLIVKKLDEPRSYLIKLNRIGPCCRGILNIPRK